MILSYDWPKRLKNIEKHGLDFADLHIDFFFDAFTLVAKQGRLKIIGEFRDGIIAVVFVALGTEALSIISMRPASRKERKIYEQSQSTR
jgi:uncharacterized protein